MTELPDSEDLTKLSLDIWTAFGSPPSSFFRDVAQDRISELNLSVNWFGQKLISEEEEWLTAFVKSSQPDKVVARMMALSRGVGFKFLPLMMTIESDERWQLGRGVLGCSLGPPRDYEFIVDDVIKSSHDIQKVVCRYVHMCAMNYEEYALYAWNHFWRSIWVSLQDV